MKKGKLTARQRRFCSEYPIDLNGTQAAIRAGYSPNGAEVVVRCLTGSDSSDGCCRFDRKGAGTTPRGQAHLVTRLAGRLVPAEKAKQHVLLYWRSGNVADAVRFSQQQCSGYVDRSELVKCQAVIQ